MKNIIVVMDYPQECGNPSMRFVDCSTGEVLKDVDFWSWSSGYWNAVYRDKTKGEPVKLFLDGGRPSERLKNLTFEEPWLCVLRKNDYMLQLIQTFHESILEWSGTNVGSLSETEDVNPKTWIRPEETQFYEMISCKYLYTKHHQAILRSRTSDKSADYSYNSHLFEVELVPIVFSKESTYHKSADPLYEDLAEQGIDPSGISEEDREQRDDRWFAHYIAKQFDWKILNII